LEFLICDLFDLICVGYGIWENNDREIWFGSWKPIEQWAEQIYTWVKNKIIYYYNIATLI
jgi:hypothetical protein